MSLFDNPEYMAQSKAELRHYVLYGEMPDDWMKDVRPVHGGPKREYRRWRPEDHKALAKLLRDVGDSVYSAANFLGLNPASANSMVTMAGGRQAYIRKYTQEHV